MKEVRKGPKVALCRVCGGTGKVDVGGYHSFPCYDTCPQCEGSGRVVVSCKMELEIKPYHPQKQ